MSHLKIVIVQFYIVTLSCLLPTREMIKYLLHYWKNIYLVFSGLTFTPNSLQALNHSKCKSQSTKAQNPLHKSNTPLANPQHISTNPDITRRMSSKHMHFNRFHSVLCGSEPKVTYWLTQKHFIIHTLYIVDIIMASEYFKSIV